MNLKTIVITIIISFLWVSQIKSQIQDSPNKDSITVTYIANEGILVTIDDKKMVIDGIFSEGFDRYEIPDSESLDKLINNESPFDNLDLIFVTHKHLDHFNDSLVYKALINNPSTKLICPKQVDDIMRNCSESYDKVQEQIKVLTTDIESFVKSEINGVNVYACRLWHGKKQNMEIENNGYIIEYNNNTIFHSGDATVQDFNGVDGLDLSDLEIDVAFLFNGFGGIPFIPKTEKLVRADNYVFIHIAPDFKNRFFQPFIDNPDLMKNASIFNKKLETRTFYTKY